MPPAVLITGAAKRIGAVLARAFAGAGCHVVIHAGHSPEAAEALASELPSAEVVICDLTDSNAAVAMVEELAGRLVDWRLLVNNAAVFRPDTAEAIDPEVFAEAIHFLDQKIANPNPDFFSYTMAKHALASTVRMLAMAQQRGDDRIYGLAPGAMLPSHDQRAEEHERSGRMNLLQRLTDPQELADAALWLAQGWLASGETLFVDSGQHLLSQPRDVLYLARQ
jgi:NAD(P)-dependent dehydrogenase (short-subunit alcohol dehydrogenase family)